MRRQRHPTPEMINALRLLELRFVAALMVLAAQTNDEGEGPR